MRELPGVIVILHILIEVCGTGICFCQNSGSAHFKFMHFTIDSFYSPMEGEV